MSETNGKKPLFDTSRIITSIFLMLSIGMLSLLFFGAKNKADAVSVEMSKTNKNVAKNEKEIALEIVERIHLERIVDKFIKEQQKISDTIVKKLDSVEKNVLALTFQSKSIDRDV
jgi:hypothetical protein